MYNLSVETRKYVKSVCYYDAEYHDAREYKNMKESILKWLDG